MWRRPPTCSGHEFHNQHEGCASHPTTDNDNASVCTAYDKEKKLPPLHNASLNPKSIVTLQIAVPPKFQLDTDGCSSHLVRSELKIMLTSLYHYFDLSSATPTSQFFHTLAATHSSALASIWSPTTRAVPSTPRTWRCFHRGALSQQPWANVHVSSPPHQPVAA